MYIILDTNILLLDASNLITVAQSYENSTVVLPETVLDEIDSKKSGHSEIAYQARQFGRLLTTAQVTNTVKQNGLIVTELLLDNLPIHVVSADKYPYYSEHTANIVNDRKIIHIAKLYTNRHSNVLFISNDIMCRLRAQAEGIRISDHKLVEDLDTNFVKSLEVSPTVFPNLHNFSITSIDANYQPENYNYLFIDTSTGQQKLATISNGTIQIIGKDTEDKLRLQDLPPLNSGQLFLSKAIQDPNVDIVVAEASAGTGKTATALSNAIKLVRDSKSPYESIHYIRSSVDDLEQVESVGFLSGNDEKIEVYIRPLEDTLEVIARNRLKKNKLKPDELELKISETVEKLRAQCNIQGLITLGLRGRTLRNSVIIIDEVSNLSKASLQKVLTRVGEHCKIILIGSNKQIDNPYLNKYTNGLSTILDACRTTHDTVRLHAVSLQKVVRSKLAEFAETIFSKD